MVSAIVAAYNEERHIDACLASVRAQTWRPLEILVANDGSTDRTAERAHRHADVRVLDRLHESKARALNAAALEATGEILVFLDADLRYDADYVRGLVAPILAGEVIGTSHADEFVANPENVWSRCLQAHYGLPPERRLNLNAEQLALGTPVFRAIGRDLFLRVGGFDDTGYLDDQTLCSKVGERAKFVRGAVCYHHNPERLSEVFGTGVWAGKSVHHLHGARALVRHFPVFAAARAAAAAMRLRMPAMAPYLATYETGIFWGVLQRATGLDRRLGA